MTAYFVGECTVTGDIIVEGNRDIYRIGDNVFKIPKFLEIVLSFDVFLIGSVHTSEKTTERGNPISFSNAKNRSINVRGPSFQSRIRISDSTTGIVMEMAFNVAGYNPSKCPHEIIDLSWIGTSNLNHKVNEP